MLDPPCVSEILLFARRAHGRSQGFQPLDAGLPLSLPVRRTDEHGSREDFVHQIR